MASTTTQQTLFAYHDPAEFSEEMFDKTLIIHLESPTQRKQSLLDGMINEASAITDTAQQRMPSVPRERWGSATSKGNTWYKWAKEMDHLLSNKDAVANIQRVREAYRRWQSEGYDGDRPLFNNDDRCTVDHEKPKYEVHDDRYYLFLQYRGTTGGYWRDDRVLLPLRDGEYIREYIDRLQNEVYSPTRSELLRRSTRNGDARYEFHQGLREPVELLQNPTTSIGVDVGLTNLAVAAAVTSDGDKRGAEVWQGSETAEYRDRYYEAKRRAQTDGKYEQLREEEHRYVEQVCDTISRRVIEFALGYDRPEIVLEDLTDIRDTFIKREREYSPDDRRVLHSWPFRQLQSDIEYKAHEAGIPVEYLSEDGTRYSSQECNECGHTAEENRNSVHFECVDCGYQVNADVNAAINIAGQENGDNNG